jgi:hypothetical protein
VNPKWLTFNWTHNDTNPAGSLKSFRLVVYKGTDPNLSSNYIVEPIMIPATETSAVVPVLVADQVTVFGAIQAVYVNGNESSWRTISGTIVVDPDTVSLKDAAGVTAIQASVNDIVSDDVLDTSEKAHFNLVYTTVTQEQTSVDAQATNFSGIVAVTTAKTSYDNAVTNLTAYVNALSPAFTDFTLNTPLGVGGGATMRTKFALVFSTREALLKAVADAQKALADAAQSGVIVPNPNFDQDMNSTWPNMTQIAAASAPAGCPTPFCGRAQARDQIAGPRFPVTPGAQIYYEAWIDTTQTTHTASFGLYFRDAANNLFMGVYGATAPAGSAWAKRSATLTVPAGAVSAHCFCQIEATSSFGSAYFTGLRVSEGIPAQTGVNTINDPDTLTTGEKPQIILDYNAVTGENADLVNKAGTYGVSHGTYDTAYSALLSYLSTLTSPTAWNSLSGTTALGTGNRVALWNPKWTAVKNAAADLRNAIAVGTAQNAISTAATDATNKANAAQLASQPHQVAWAYASKPALPDPAYPAGYYAITTDARTVQVSAAGTAWTDVLVATTGLFGQLFANQLTVANFDNLIPNPNSDQAPPAGGWPPGSFESAGLLVNPSYAHTGNSCRVVSDYTGNTVTKGIQVTPVIPCAVGDQFLGQFWAFSGSATGAAGLYISWRNASYSEVASTFLTTPLTGVYAKSSFIAQAPSGLGVIGFSVSIAGYSIRNQDVFFDDLYFRRMADANLIVDGTLQALVARVPLLYSLDMRSGSDASGYQAGTANSAPIGYRISAGGFTSTAIGGTTFTAQVELGYGVNFGGYQVGPLTARAMSAIGDNGQTGTSFRCWYRGSNDPGTLQGAPNIARFYVQSAWQNTSTGRFMLNFFLRPAAYTDNFDGMRYAKIEFWRGNTSSATKIMTSYCNLPDRLYYSTTDSDPGNASAASVYFENDTTSGILSGNDPRFFLFITIYNAAGPSASAWFVPPSALETDWTQQTSSPFSGGSSGGGGGGGINGGGTCPAPDVPLLMADGTEKPAGQIRVGDRVVAWDEAAGCECIEEVTFVERGENTVARLYLDNGQDGRFAMNHRFLTHHGEWTELQHLHAGEKLHGASVVCVQPLGFAEVVKITVNRVHTYITLGVVSHNVKALIT